MRDARDGDLVFRPDEEVDRVEEGAQDDVADLRQGAVADLLRKVRRDGVPELLPQQKVHHHFGVLFLLDEDQAAPEIPEGTDEDGGDELRRVPVMLGQLVDRYELRLRDVHVDHAPQEFGQRGRRVARPDVADLPNGIQLQIIE